MNRSRRNTRTTKRSASPVRKIESRGTSSRASLATLSSSSVRSISTRSSATSTTSTYNRSIKPTNHSSPSQSVSSKNHVARSFSSAAEDPDLAPTSKRKQRPFDYRNPYAKDTPQDQEKIAAFLKPLNLDQYTDKFVSFDQMLSIRTPLLKREMGMNCRERKLLRRKANEFIVTYYYTTGEVYQSKYPTRQPIPHQRYHRDESSEDETSYILPAKDGLYRAHLRYPGASFKENTLVQTYDDFRLAHAPNLPIKEELLQDVDARLKSTMGALAPNIDPKGTVFLDQLLGADDYIYGSGSEIDDRELNINHYIRDDDV